MIKLPKRTDHGVEWRLYFGTKVPYYDAIVLFNSSLFGKPLLLEYDGDIEKIKTLANNEALLRWLCDRRREWFRSLCIINNATKETMTFILFDTDGNILGFAALWNYDMRKISATYRLGREFMTFPIQKNIIVDTSYSYEDLVKVSNDNIKRFENFVKNGTFEE